MEVKKISYYVSLLAIIVISYFLYSSRFFPLLNSDDALNILMTFYYRLPHDFYCWGQDRGGTLIPLISQVFHRIFGFSAVNSVSLSNYLLLILGYVGFSSLFRNKYIKILFALVWFLPPARFIDLARYPIGVQYSLIGFAIFLINKVNFWREQKVVNHILMLSAVLVLIISVWVSDLAVVSITALLFTLIFFHFQNNRNFRFRWPVYLYTIVGIIGGFFFIWYAKSFATDVTNGYTSVNNLDTFFKAILILGRETFSVLTFQNKELLFSFYVWGVIISVTFLLFSYQKQTFRILRSRQRWVVFFTFDFVSVLGVILLSRWVYYNGMGRWYFVSSYISFFMIILILLDNLGAHPKKQVIKLALFFTIITGSLSSVHFMNYIWPKTLKSKIDVRAELLALGEVGIIGEFWNSYISACPDPSKIIATAHDKSVVRSQELVDEVFEQPKLYVIKDMWLKSFPDTMEQFGYLLVKKGDSLNIADCFLNEYVKVKRNQEIPLAKFLYNPGVVPGNNKLLILQDSVGLKNNYVIWGPNLDLGIGNFVVRYKLNMENVTGNKAIAKFDVTTDYGSSVLISKELKSEDWPQIENGSFDVEFSCSKRVRNVEFRILYYGNADLIIDKLELIEK